MALVSNIQTQRHYIANQILIKIQHKLCTIVPT